jgi:transposase
MTLHVRELTAEEQDHIKHLSQSRIAPARSVERARIIQLASGGLRVPAIAQRLQIGADVVRLWLTRFNAHGVAGLNDASRCGRPTTYTADEIGVVVATALTDPKALDQAFGSWTFDRLAYYLHEQQGIAIKRSRIHEVLQAEGLRWRQQESWFGARVDPDFAQKRGRSRRSTPSRQRAAS